MVAVGTGEPPEPSAKEDDILCIGSGSETSCFLPAGSAAEDELLSEQQQPDAPPNNGLAGAAAAAMGGALLLAPFGALALRKDLRAKL